MRLKTDNMKKLLSLVLVVFLGSWQWLNSATTLRFESLSDSEREFVSTLLRSVSLVGDSMVFTASDGTIIAVFDKYSYHRIVFTNDHPETSLLISQQRHICVFPNPTYDSVHIRGLNEEEEVDVVIYDIQGKIVVHKRIKANASIDVNKLPTGTYFFQVNGETNKLIKQ